jgi:uncharacterized protein YqjF (DUF2071 family)
MNSGKAFLTAEWRDLVMLNFVADPGLLKRFVPRETEIDTLNGRTFLSLVGFHFLKAKIMGVAFPFHRNFEEVNLRFYVRRKCGGTWRRGVVFVREIVPRRIVALVARMIYGERFMTFPMRHSIENLTAGQRVTYGWRRNGEWESVSATATGEPRLPRPFSEEEFIFENYWGYTARGIRTAEFRVEHSPWKIRTAVDARFEAEIATLYGSEFVETLAVPPAISFIAHGSRVIVRQRSILPADE